MKYISSYEDELGEAHSPSQGKKILWAHVTSKVQRDAEGGLGWGRGDGGTHSVWAGKMQRGAISV